MDQLVQVAQEWSSSLLSRPQPVQGRVAYAVAHGVSYASNGYAVRTHLVAQALVKHKFDVCCMVQPGRPWELGNAVSVDPVTRLDKVSYIHSPSYFGDGGHSVLRLLAHAERFLDLFRLYRPQVVMAASDWKVGLPAWAASRRLGIPFFNEIRGFWELSETARRPEHKQEAQYSLGVERDTFLACHAQKVFTLSEAMRQELVRRGVVQKSIQLVPNGVVQIPKSISNLDQQQPGLEELRRRLGIEPHDKIIGYVGSFNVYEGLDVLVEACRRLVAQGEPVKLILVGNDQPVTGLLSAPADGCSKEPWLIQIGRVPHDLIADYYGLMDVIAIARLPVDVCLLVPPMKIVEALAHQKKVVVSDVEPLLEYAEKFPQVSVCEAGSAESLARTIKDAMDAPKFDQMPSALLMEDHVMPMVKALREV